MLKKSNRLTSKFQFNIVKKYGRRENYDIFGVTVLRPKNYLGTTRIGFVVPNAIDKRATHRNKVKRLLREAVRKNVSKLPENLWITIFVYPKILGKSYAEISSQVDRFIQKISISH